MTEGPLDAADGDAAPRGAAGEAEFVAALARGNGAAYEQLVRQHGGRMLAVARRMLSSEADADDAVQEAFLAAFRAIGSFQGQSQLGTWLHRIVVNACLMRLRSRAARPSVSIESLLPTFDETGHHTRTPVAWSTTPDELASRAELRAQVRSCIDRLPEGYREVLVLRDLEELDTEETARALGIHPGAVKTRLHRARQALRTLLEANLRASEV